MTDGIVCRVLTGPTASGKSDLSVRLAAENGWDIISMDSMQIYRRMNIGTAKPTIREMGGVRHYMIDICDPSDPYSVAQYRDDAEKLIVLLHEQGHEVLITGGTTLYLQAMIRQMTMGNVPADAALREKLNRQASEPEGRKQLLERLKEIDPITAARLHVNDVRRIIRAIEVWESTGKPFSSQQERSMEYDRRFVWKIASTRMERAMLYDRINLRVTGMIKAGLKDEVASLIEDGISPEAQSMNGIGYKEMIPCIYGEYSLEEAAERIRTNTRHYAKRQMTFLRRIDQVAYVDTDRAGAWDKIRQTLV
jgi:tRNA dimethylallyltransferase